MMRSSRPNRLWKTIPDKILDPTLRDLQNSIGIKNLRRRGLYRVQHNPSVGIYGQEPYKNAFPVLNNTDFGFYEHAADTHWAEMGSMMPRKGKGLPPWYRGADTYSPLFNEQGRWEYQRYTMIHRFPRDYKMLFQWYLMRIRLPVATNKKPYALPQHSMHWLLRMLVDNLNPQHVHYQAAMETMMYFEEYDLAFDVWKVMERQQTIPDDKLIALYLQLCTLTKDKDSAFECWNRYCSEKQFLQENEVDPKPVTRVPFSLTREELFHLPKWKKHFDHDPNLDVVDLNRFNTTRNIYRWMAASMLSAGEVELMDTFLATLDEKLLTTPTPVPEPPNPNLMPKQAWDPYFEQAIIESPTWTNYGRKKSQALGPSNCIVEESHSRFFSNEQYVLKLYGTLYDIIAENPSCVPQPYEFAQKLMGRCEKVLAIKMKNLDIRTYLSKELRLMRVVGKAGGQQLYDHMHKVLSARQEVPHAIHYLQILESLAEESVTSKQPQSLIAFMSIVTQEMNCSATVQWSLPHHVAILKCLVNCNTMKGNEYFVTNILRKYVWRDDCCRILYEEYKRHPSVDMWAELTKRMLVWTARYNVKITEVTKRLIEADYDTIQVQMRTLQELVVFKYRNEAEKLEKADPISQLPNPIIDKVNHALPFPDRDTGFPNEYGELGQWRHPNENMKTKGPGYWAPRMYGEIQKGYHSTWRDSHSPMTPVKLAPPFDRKYKEYARGNHPSYDMVYAGPHPEIFPNTYNFRRKTRWDFQDIHKQSKFKMHGPL
eukprot:PhF_6_TR12303/c0_g1_i1/m.19541